MNVFFFFDNKAKVELYTWWHSPVIVHSRFSSQNSYRIDIIKYNSRHNLHQSISRTMNVTIINYGQNA